MGDHFPPDAVIRRVNRETSLLVFGAGRALLLQLALPEVAAGVRDHSEFEQNPFKRLEGTLEATYAAVFGSEELAAGVGRRIQHIHDHVVGPTYRANDPDNLLWVHATLVDTALGCYTRLVGPLTDDEQETYYRQMIRVGEVFGVPRDVQPPTLAEFRTYFDERVRSLEVTDTGRELVAFILRPTLPARLDVPLRPLLALQRWYTVGTTPEPLRAAFGLRWSSDDQQRLARFERAVRAVNGRLPRLVRTAPTDLGRQVWLRQAARHVTEFDARQRQRSAA